MGVMEVMLVLVGVAWNAITSVLVVHQFAMVVVLGAQVAQIVLLHKVVVVVINAIHHVMNVAIVVIAVIAQLVIVAINVQIVKLAIHNVIQIINKIVCKY